MSKDSLWLHKLGFLHKNASQQAVFLFVGLWIWEMNDNIFKVLEV